MKDLEFLGNSQEDIRKFPAEARRDAGFQLHFVQMGQNPSDWKPMKTVGSGVVEIRIHKGCMYCTRSKRKPGKRVNPT